MLSVWSRLYRVFPEAFWISFSVVVYYSYSRVFAFTVLARLPFNPAFFSFQFLSFQFPHGIFKNSLTLSLSPVKDFLRCVSPDLFDVLPLCIIFWHYRFLKGIVGIETCWTKWSRMLYWLYLFWAHLGCIWSPCLSWFFFLYFLRRSLAGIIRRLWSDKILSHHPDLNWSLMLQQNLIWHTRDFHSDYFIRVFLITIVLFEDLFSKVLSSMITFQDHLVADPVQSVLVQCYL